MTTVNREVFVERVGNLSEGLIGAMHVETLQWAPDDANLREQYETAVLLLQVMRWLRALSPADRLGWLAYMHDLITEMNAEDRTPPESDDDEETEDAEDDETEDDDSEQPEAGEGE